MSRGISPVKSERVLRRRTAPARPLSPYTRNCGDDVWTRAQFGMREMDFSRDIQFRNPVCVDPNSSSDPNTLDTSIQGGFIILPATSSGKFGHATGTGQVDAYVNASDPDGATYLSGRGVLQVGSPF